MSFLSPADLEAAFAATAAIPGWFRRTDAVLMNGIAQHQHEHGVTGDVLEVGAYLGASAVFLGRLLDKCDRLVVCDLFEAEARSEENRRENADQYERTLTRTAFERNYLLHHPALPVVHQCLSTDLPGKIEPGFRLAHIDGSHLYDVVQSDIRLVLAILAPGGMAVFDDIRSPHTPGVAAAVWGAVERAELYPVALSPQKLYCAVDPSAGAAMAAHLGRAAVSSGLRSEVQRVAESDLVRVWPAPVSATVRVTTAIRKRARDVRGRLGVASPPR